MTSFLSAVAIAAATLSAAPVPAQENEATVPAGTVIAGEVERLTDRIDETDILVNRTVKEERQAITNLARDVLGRIKTHEPLPSFHNELCLSVIGIKDEFVEDFRARILENAALAGVRIAEDNCSANALVAITPDARNELKMLRKAQPALFGDLPTSARNRILASRDPAFAFQITEVLGDNGTQVGPDPLAGGGAWDPSSSAFNYVYGMYGRISKRHSINFRSSVVVIDADAAEGKTATQLADYASLRLLLPTKEIEQRNEDAPATIMTLFIHPENAPDELTPFDIGFLQAGYKMARNIAAGGLFGQTARVITNPKAR